MTDKMRRADAETYWASSVIGEGKRDAGDPRAFDTRTTAEIIAAYIEGQRNDDAGPSLSTVHYRGGEPEFRAGIELLASDDPRERAVGADVLAQLGWQDRAFLDESVDALLSALHDPDDLVVQSAIFALGHRASPRAIALLLPFVDNSSADLRYAELVGLARRRDTSIATAILRELEGDFHGDWAVEAAGSLGDPRFLPALIELGQRLTGENAVYFRGNLQAAIAGCEGRRGESTSTLQ